MVTGTELKIRAIFFLARLVSRREEISERTGWTQGTLENGSRVWTHPSGARRPVDGETYLPERHHDQP